MSRRNVQAKPKEGNKIRLVKQNGKKKQKKITYLLNRIGGGENIQVKASRRNLRKEIKK